MTIIASLKYEIPLLDHNTRFALWQIKMQVVLAQIDLEDALLGIDKMHSTLTEEEKNHRNANDDRGRTQERNTYGKSKGRSKSSNRGCTFHMSPSQDWFKTYETMSEGVILMGNNASCKNVGVGTIKVRMFDGVVRTLSDVRHVPGLKRNLILLSTLDLKGYKYTAKSRDSTVTSDVPVTSSSLSDDDITKLWHMHLVYISENDMVELSKRGLFDGCPAYAHADNGKLEPRSIKCVFLGYKACVKGIRRAIKPPKKYAKADLVVYALNVAEDIYANQEPSNFSEEVVRCKWVFKKTKRTLGIEEPRYKARLVVKGYSQIPRVDFTDVFSSVVKHSLIQALLGIVVRT
ncbi:hypothetical protein CXB51_016632 [Gossypium anomalum]|uniref:Reverse transcriptase Ty1/copia-type domain-containing protein n=1 Tax=Gossypium anomalum TaxID=47600 RepID=A0A8J6D088_9ROSI|nr:hypothetical protein CXB51_016632 [Gossypium anomalum]